MAAPKKYPTSCGTAWYVHVPWLDEEPGAKASDAAPRDGDDRGRRSIARGDGSEAVARRVLGAAALVVGILLAGPATLLVPRDLLLGVLTGGVASSQLAVVARRAPAGPPAALHEAA